jgi:hypothetical protein
MRDAELAGKLDGILDQLVLGEGPDQISVPGLFNALGFPFAVVARADPGLSDPGASIAELSALADLVWAQAGVRGITYVVGVSQGGLLAVKAVEEAGEAFDGVAAGCGPIGHFQRQLDHLASALVLFDYLFDPEVRAIFGTGLLEAAIDPSAPPVVSAAVLETWAAHADDVRDAFLARPVKTGYLLRLARIPDDPTQSLLVADELFAVIEEAALGLADTVAQLGGYPTDNRNRLYFGSGSRLVDYLVNLGVKRYAAGADPARVAAYEATGQLNVYTTPVVTLHTLRDPRVPYWHEPRYRAKVLANGAGNLLGVIPVIRYGHCNFQPEEALVAFVLLVLKTSAVELTGAEAALPSEAARLRLRGLLEVLRAGPSNAAPSE